MVKKQFSEKLTGDFLTAEEWNELTEYVNDVVDELNEGGGGSGSGGGTVVNSPVTTEVDSGDSSKTNISINNIKVAELTNKGDKGTNITLAGNNNINIEPREALGTGEGKNLASNANRKGGNIALKPGDDIEFWGHHRGTAKNTEVAVKVLTETEKGTEVSADLQLGLSNLILTSKDKKDTVKFIVLPTYSGNIDIEATNEQFFLSITIDKLTCISDLTKYAGVGDNGIGATFIQQLGNLDPGASLIIRNIVNDVTTFYEAKKSSDVSNVINIEAKADGQKAYLKIRAHAIDLRCEDHGGIALQPKGVDSLGHMNKIKFEHGGGDGLEFGTFNTEHTSLFTDDYRFNKGGIIRLATRTKVASDKADVNDLTTTYKYTKQADDFYDIINVGDPVCTWEDIVKVASAFNGNYTLVSSSGKNLVISTVPTITITHNTQNANINSAAFDTSLEDNTANVSDIEEKTYTLSDFNSATGGFSSLMSSLSLVDGNVYKLVGSSGLFVIAHYDEHDASFVNSYNLDLDPVYMSDIIKAVKWMKSNSQGPWA